MLRSKRALLPHPAFELDLNTIYDYMSVIGIADER